MKMSMVIYVFFTKVFGVINGCLDHIICWLKFDCLCDDFHDLNYINESIHEKSLIRIGKNFHMNNDMDGNQIVLGITPCILQTMGGQFLIDDNVGIRELCLFKKYINKD